MTERRVEEIARDVLACALAWESGARLLGNVTAAEVAALARAVIGESEEAEPLNHAAGCTIYDGPVCTCGKSAREAARERFVVVGQERRFEKCFECNEHDACAVHDPSSSECLYAEEADHD